MEDPENLSSTLFLLPPGCRFYPSEEQLVCYYLTCKINDDRGSGFDVISEVDLYNYDPFDLPETACFRFGRGGRRRHWYCYVARVLNERGRRNAGGGYWKRKGRVRDVVGGIAGKVVVGTRKSFVFYLGDCPKSAMRTNWVMHEYALVDDHKASFVLCRIFVKKDENLRLPVGLIGEQNDQVTVEPVGDASCEHPSTIMPDEPMTSSEAIGDVSMSPNDLAAEHLMSILEEGFIEMDDLACPLVGTRFA